MSKITSGTKIGRIRAQLRSGGLTLLLAFGVTLAVPSLLSANPSFTAGSANLPQQRPGAPGSGAQAPASPALQDGSNEPGKNIRPVRQQPPKNADGEPQGRPSKPNHGSGPRPPQQGGPAATPGRPAPDQGRPPVHNHPPHYPSPRPPVHHHPHYVPGYPHYIWGGGNGWRLHQYFRPDMERVNRWHRRAFYAGGYIPPYYMTYIQPVPPHLLAYLPPVPAGLEIGYYGGYCLVFDPDTLLIFSVIDLYRY